MDGYFIWFQVRFPLPVNMEILLEKHTWVAQFPPPHQPHSGPGLGQVLYMYLYILYYTMSDAHCESLGGDCLAAAWAPDFRE